MSFFADKIVSEGLTFDDVLLIPSYSEVLPLEVDLSSWFTRNIRINTPVVTAAMDTVTDSLMAIAIAREGGIGVIHASRRIQAWPNLKTDRPGIEFFFRNSRHPQQCLKPRTFGFV